MNNYELDDSAFRSDSERDFSDFLSERENNAKWVDVATKNLNIGVKSAISPPTAISEQALREAHFFVELVLGNLLNCRCVVEVKYFVKLNV